LAFMFLILSSWNLVCPSGDTAYHLSFLFRLPTESETDRGAPRTAGSRTPEREPVGARGLRSSTPSSWPFPLVTSRQVEFGFLVPSITLSTIGQMNVSLMQAVL
jgi:hypothetical protein